MKPMKKYVYGAGHSKTKCEDNSWCGGFGIELDGGFMSGKAAALEYAKHQAINNPGTTYYVMTIEQAVVYEKPAETPGLTVEEYKK